MSEISKFYITIQGYEKLKEEHKERTTKKRPEIVQKIAEAREHGDLSENAEYEAARNEQSMNEGKIIELETKLASADIIDITKLSGPAIKFGATVKLFDDDANEETIFSIVGPYEADIAKKLLSISSPLGKALIGKSEGDIVEVQTPTKRKSYEVLSVEYIELSI